MRAARSSYPGAAVLRFTYGRTRARVVPGASPRLAEARWARRRPGPGAAGWLESAARRGGVVPPPPGPGPQAIASCTPELQNQVGPTPLRRISSLEYQNAVRDLFGETIDLNAASGFPSDEKVGSFISNVKTPLSATNNEGYMTAAEGRRPPLRIPLRDRVGLRRLATRPAPRRYLLELARRAFHGTLDADAETALRTLYTNVRQMVDANGGGRGGRAQRPAVAALPVHDRERDGGDGRARR